jgi:type III restriction enzyme
VTQVIGRVLRQPGAQHYPDPNLNTAHFYIRTDEKHVFDDVLHEVRLKIAAEAPDINLTVFTGSRGTSSKLTVKPKKTRQLPEVSIDAAPAAEPIRNIEASIQDYRKGGVNTVGKGRRIQVLQSIGSNGREQEEWVDVEHSNRVTARWVFVREVQRFYAKAINLCDIDNAKLDAQIEYNSLAAEHIREVARKVVEAFLTHSRVINNYDNPKAVPEISVDPANIRKFTSALHEGYSDLNNLEEEFAKALDKTQRVWFRNSSRGLFEIPLLTFGSTKNFNPDFIVWVDKDIIAIDTKG